MRLLVTGGAGYVGSHFVWAAHARGDEVTILDDLSGSPVLPPLPPGVPFILGDVGDEARLSELFSGNAFDAVVHFAGKLRVDESVREPNLYYDVNVERPLRLLSAASARGVRLFVASSSCAVYGEPPTGPISETLLPSPVSPYGASKLAFELALRCYEKTRGLRWAAPRYFNAAGAHKDGFLYEGHDPQTHLLPSAIDAALGLRSPLTVYGANYGTRDGTAIRDYVHVSDVVSAHLLALDHLATGRSLRAFNLGTGEGRTVLEILDAVKAVLNASVPFELGQPREGDPESLVADPALARSFGWAPERSDLRTIVEDAVRSRVRAYDKSARG